MILKVMTHSEKGDRKRMHQLDMMALPVRDPYLTQEDATLPPAHEDQEEPVMINNHRDEEEAVEPLAESDEQAHDVAPRADNVCRSTHQRQPPDRLGSWVYF